MFGRKSRKTTKLQRQLDEAKQEPFSAKDIVWIFGFGRFGSTWLLNMMGDLPGCVTWSEPMIGALFGNFRRGISYYGINVSEAVSRVPTVILGSDEERWVPLVRQFVLGACKAWFPTHDGTLVIKEPNGSVGADILSRVTPESRMILLVRDPRDAMASALAAYSPGSWAPEALMREDIGGITVEAWSEWYVQNMSVAVEAYEAHAGQKTTVFYEELVSNALGHVGDMCCDIGIEVEDAQLAAIVEKHSWKNIPTESKGEGKFNRKGLVGGWKDDLSHDAVTVVEDVSKHVMNRFGYERIT